MRQVVITVGMPGAGKTTFARQLLADDPSFVLVSKDEVRKAMFGSKKAFWRRVDGIGFNSSEHQHIEALVRNVCYDMAERAVIDNNIVICNTSFDWAAVYPYIDKLTNHARIYVKVFDESLEELRRRNKHRPPDDRISSEYIENMYADWCKLKRRPWWEPWPIWEDRHASAI